MNTFTDHKALLVSIALLAGNLAHLPAAYSQTATTKRPIPLEQIISQIRKQNESIVVYSARLIQEDHRTVRQIDFNTDYRAGRQAMQRLIVDAFTGKEIELVTMRTPMSLEKTLNNLRKKHNIATITKTWIEQKEGNEIRIIEFSDNHKKRWHSRMDAYTGLLIDEHSYELKPSGKQISLSEVLEEVRKNHKNMIVLRTTAKHQKNIPVREIVYLDENNFRKRLVVNAITGATISDQLATYPFY